MSPERFDHLLELLKPIIQKKDTNFYVNQYQLQKDLVLTLRFLAIGDSQQSLSFSYRLGKATVSKIISETCKSIYTVLKDPYLRHLLVEKKNGLKFPKSSKKSGICHMLLGALMANISG